VRERSQDVSIVEVPAHKVMLPGTPHGLFVRGELHDFLHLPCDGTRVEIIGGEVVVSPAPAFGHGGIVQDISDLVAMARVGKQAFPWRCIQVTGLNLVGVEDGYIPDLMFLDAEAFEAARRANVICLVPDEVELAVEVTSPRNAFRDRAPSGDDKVSKWCGYAKAEIPYYLLIDRDPQVARAVLYSIPDAGAGAYLHQESWAFGEAIRLPEQFGIDIPTADWLTWA
jgi:Uma2 family endonuclease